MNTAIAKVLQRSFEIRQDVDYEDFVAVSEDRAKQLERDVNDFIDETEKILKKLLEGP